MRILLDTNVVSELLRDEPEARVVRWLDSRPAHEFLLSAISAAELIRGVDRLPPGRRRTTLGNALAQVLDEDFADRIIPFDSTAAVEFSAVVSRRERQGRPISMADAMIAATAIATGATQLATRNVADFEGVGIDVVYPWMSR